MKLVLLSGGSGKRLWPLSNDSRSKQFLRVLQGASGYESMLERVWGQLKESGLDQDSYIASGKAQLEMIQNQLDQKAKVIIEPSRRDTFPAIALSASYLYSMERTALDEVVVVLPVDPYVERKFFDKVKQLEHALAATEANIALIGVKPTYPSEKYGYIVPREAVSDKPEILSVSHFVEKPTEADAETLIRDKALWNCGVFGFRLRFLLEILKNMGLPTDYQRLSENYNQIQKISFDYAVVEKTKKIVALPYDGEWKDLGTWNTLTEELPNPVIGKGSINGESPNTHLINELDIPVVIISVPNVVVATSPDGILVTDKASSPQIKEVIEKFDQKPMYEERRWGWYKILDFTKQENDIEVLAKRVHLDAGKNLSYHMHNKRSEMWTIINGRGEFVLDNRLQHVEPGQILKIPAGVHHSIRAITDIEFIEVQVGSELHEEDIVRTHLEWDSIEKTILNGN